MNLWRRPTSAGLWMAANGGYSNRRGPDELMKDVGVSVAIVGDLAPAVAKSVVLHRVAANLGVACPVYMVLAAQIVSDGWS